MLARLTIALALAGCAAPTAPAAPHTRTADAPRADALFWDVFHGAAYDRIPDALRALKAVYLRDPHDAVTAARIGWLHIWRLAEHARGPADPAITDDAVLGRRYFERAVELAPGEPRYLGFYASLLLTEASIHGDDALRRRGTETMHRAVAQWPEFNLFTAGYGASAQPYDSPAFRDALAAEQRNLALCAGPATDRARQARACTSSEIAPHNREGFCLNLGDMLVKAGQVDAAIAMYGRATVEPGFAAWPYRGVLEARIRDARANVERFRRGEPGEPAMMIRSSYACMGCHQR